MDFAVARKQIRVETGASDFHRRPATERMTDHGDLPFRDRAEFFRLRRNGLNRPVQIDGPLPQLRRRLRAAVMGGGAGMVDRRNDVTLMGQRARQPTLIAPVAAITVGEHDQRVLASGWWRVAHGGGANEDYVIGDQFGCGCGCARVPDDHLQRTLVVRVGEGGGLEAEGVSESVGRQDG